MEKSFLEATLAQVERHVVRGEMHVTRQREIVNDKKHSGLDHSASADLLETFEMLLEQHKAHRASLIRALNAA